MNPENFEQLSAGETSVGTTKWMAGIVCIITLWNGGGAVMRPPRIDLKVVATGAHRDRWQESRQARRRPVRVPLFINEGEVLRIDTRG
jgi:elongation factor P